MCDSFSATDMNFAKLNPKVKTAKQRLSDFARRTSQDVGYEIREFPKDAKSQVTGSVFESLKGETQTTSSIVEAMQQKTETDENPELKTIKGAKDIDEEMDRLREKRKQLMKEWEEQQESAMSTNSVIEPGKPLVIPSSKPARGTAFKPGGKGKQKSPETRKSKH